MHFRAELILFVVALVPFAANAASDQGKVLDRAVLARVESYCVDTANLADDEALVVKNFLKDQGKPKGLLKDLRWKRVEGCQDSVEDSTIKLEFPVFINPTPGPWRGARDRVKGILRVIDNSTFGIIYTAEALPLEAAPETPAPNPRHDDRVMIGTNLHQRRLDALRRVFLMLIHDVKDIPPRPAR